MNEIRQDHCACALEMIIIARVANKSNKTSRTQHSLSNTNNPKFPNSQHELILNYTVRKRGGGDGRGWLTARFDLKLSL